MSDSEMSRGDATVMLHAAAGGDPRAAEELLGLLYAQLRGAAQEAMKRERVGHTLGATALVHEAYLRLVGPRDVPWEGRGHFYAAAAEAMRRVLVDHARARGAEKRGGKAARVDLEAGAVLRGEGEGDGTDFVALDEAMSRLEGKDPRAAQIVRLRYYAGLSIPETAMALGVSERTVKGDWGFARAWLAREIGGKK